MIMGTVIISIVKIIITHLSSITCQIWFPFTSKKIYIFTMNLTKVLVYPCIFGMDVIDAVATDG